MIYKNPTQITFSYTEFTKHYLVKDNLGDFALKMISEKVLALDKIFLSSLNTYAETLTSNVMVCEEAALGGCL